MQQILSEILIIFTIIEVTFQMHTATLVITHLSHSVRHSVPLFCATWDISLEIFLSHLNLSALGSFKLDLVYYLSVCNFKSFRFYQFGSYIILCQSGSTVYSLHLCLQLMISRIAVKSEVPYQPAATLVKLEITQEN